MLQATGTCVRQFEVFFQIRSILGGFIFEAFGNVNAQGTFDKMYLVALFLVVLNIAGMFLACRSPSISNVSCICCPCL